MTRFPQCFRCKHYRREGAAMTCDAYPDGTGIPDEILAGEHDHTQPFAGDHGIRFEPIEPVPAPGPEPSPPLP